MVWRAAAFMSATSSLRGGGRRLAQVLDCRQSVDQPVRVPCRLTPIRSPAGSPSGAAEATITFHRTASVSRIDAASPARRT